LPLNVQNEIRQAAINSGINFYTIFSSGERIPDSKIGCYMSCVKSYEVFRPMINGIAKSYHRYDATSDQRSDFNISRLQNKSFDNKYK
jgi:hypothetical protein